MCLKKKKDNYILDNEQKHRIAIELVESLTLNKMPSEDTIGFIYKWLISGKNYNCTFKDVWNIVLDNYFIKEDILLYRAGNKFHKIKQMSVASYSSSFEVAYRIMKNNSDKNKIIILNTSQPYFWKEDEEKTFGIFPLYKVLEKHNIFTYWIPEYEYIVRETEVGIEMFYSK